MSEDRVHTLCRITINRSQIRKAIDDLGEDFVRQALGRTFLPNYVDHIMDHPETERDVIDESIVAGLSHWMK